MRVAGRLLAVTLVVMCACGRASGEAHVVPWIDAPAANQVQPFTIPGVPACTAADLHVDVRVADPSYVGAGPVNTSFWAIRVRNAGGRPCFVSPSLDASFSVNGSPLAIPRGDALNGDIIYLAPSEVATGEIDVTPCLLRGVDGISVDFGPAQGNVSVAPGPPGGTGPPCPVAHETYTAGISGVDASGSVGGSLSSSETTVDAPAVVHPGTRVHFTVTIENTTRPHSQLAGTVNTPNPTLGFQPCPTYHMELEGVAGTLHTYRLNCAQAQPIPFHGRETFAMELDVPSDAPRGPASLLWSVDGPMATWQVGRSYVVVD